MELRRYGAAFFAAVMMISLCACGGKSGNTEEAKKESDSLTSVAFETMPAGIPGEEEMFTKRDLKQTYKVDEAIKIDLSAADADVPGAYFDGDTLKIQREGIYVLSGTLNGNIQINALDAKVQLVLNGAHIKSADHPAICIEEANKVFLTAVGDNVLESTGMMEEESAHGTVYAKGNLVLNGQGSLKISSEESGIVCKDNLKLCGMTLAVEAEKHALQAKNSVRIHSGTIELTAGSDGIHCENKKNTEKAYVYMCGGELSIQAGSDGIDCNREFILNGGSVRISAEKEGIHSDAGFLQGNGSCIIG